MIALLWQGVAQAVPSFGRQTGWDCARCHTMFPELTEAGRGFKLNGYAVPGAEATKADASAGAPVSALIQLDETLTRMQPPATVAGDGTDNRGQARVPDHISLLYAGPITTGLGAFTELAYDPGAGSVGLDMLDVRYAKALAVAGTDLTLGLVATNMPTMQDVWATGPAWGFPFVTSPDVPMPMADLSFMTLANTVGSLGAYLYAGNLVYAEASAYRSAHQGGGGDSFLQGYAPYWRVAVDHDLGPVSVEVGGFGIRTASLPAGAAPVGPEDHVNDVVADAQVQYDGDPHSVTLRGSVGWEQVFPDASYAAGTVGELDHQIKKVSLNGTYAFARTVAVSVGGFSVVGSTDMLLYMNSATGSPNSAGMTYEVDVFPWPNTKVTAQYTAYSKFDGDSTNYDGLGRDAKDNDALALMAQLTF